MRLDVALRTQELWGQVLRPVTEVRGSGLAFTHRAGVAIHGQGQVMCQSGTALRGEHICTADLPYLIPRAYRRHGNTPNQIAKQLGRS